MIQSSLVLATVVAMGMVAGNAQAISFTETSLNSSVGATGSEIQNDGTLVRAYHFGAGLTDVTVHGVLFMAGGAPGSFTDTALSGDWGAGFNSWNGNWSLTSLTDPAYKQLLTSMLMTSSGAAITISGLTAGHTYRLQLISNNPRNAQIEVEGSSHTLSGGDNANPVLLTATWIAGDTTLNMSVLNDNLHFCGYALHDITPATANPTTAAGQSTSRQAKDKVESSEAAVPDNELITADLLVSLSNPSFEKPGKGVGSSWAQFGSPWNAQSFPSARQQIETVTGGAFTKAAPGGGKWCALLSVDNVPVKTPLVQSWDAGVSAGDTLSVTFYLGRAKGQKGGKGIAFFKVGATLYTLAFDTTALPADSWRRTTMTQKISNSGNLSLGFCSTSASGNNSFLDSISDITVLSKSVALR